nr:radical SAM protein [Spirochaetota bacterium]
MSQVLLIIPPFTQLSSPYPSTSFLSGILNSYGVDNRQIDLGLKTALNFFSKSGVERLFDEIEKKGLKKDGKAKKFISQKNSYINTIEDVIKFLQGGNDTLAQRLVRRDFLPENNRFAILKDIDIKKLGLMESARFIAALYLDDIVDLAKNTVLPDFNLSSYYEKLAIAAHSFDKIYDQINIKKDMIWDISEQILMKEDFSEINLVCITVPFPGNLYSALKIGRWIKINYPSIKVALGGGYPNTELRSLKEKRIFEFVDYVCLDDGETPILSILDLINGKITSKNLSRTFILEENEVKLINDPQDKYVSRQTPFIPNYKDLPLSEYFTLYETTNKMHRLWSTKIFLKLQAAYGCYHAKCSFCDASLDYIKSYKVNKPELIIKQIKSVVEDTGIKAFHFVDEAIPPYIAKEIAIELIKQN